MVQVTQCWASAQPSRAVTILPRNSSGLYRACTHTLPTPHTTVQSSYPRQTTRHQRASATAKARMKLAIKIEPRKEYRGMRTIATACSNTCNNGANVMLWACASCSQLSAAPRAITTEPLDAIQRQHFRKQSIRPQAFLGLVRVASSSERASGTRSQALHCNGFTHVQRM